MERDAHPRAHIGAWDYRIVGSGPRSATKLITNWDGSREHVGMLRCRQAPRRCMLREGLPPAGVTKTERTSKALIRSFESFSVA